MTAPPEPGFFEVVERCTACWRFHPDPVPEPLIERVLEAATKGPSGGNLQPWRFIVVRDRIVRSRIAALYLRAWEQYEHTTRRLANGVIGRAGERALETGAHLARTLADVPVHIIVCAANWPTALRRCDPGLRRLDERGAIYASIFPAVQNLMLAASALGLATRLTTLHQIHEDELREILGIPDLVETVALVPLGYPAVGSRRRPRHPFRRVVFWERWQQRGEAAVTDAAAGAGASSGLLHRPESG